MLGRSTKLGILLAGAVLPVVVARTDAPAGDSAAAPRVTVKVDTAKWESGYGARFFQVVGSVANEGGTPVGAVLIRTDLLDAKGAVVAHADCWNGSAESLGAADAGAARAQLGAAKLKPIPPGGSDRWRCTFLDEDTPAFDSHRVSTVAVLPAP